MKNLLGGKGANLAEMCRLGITVPPGFTISTEACTVYTEQGQEAALADRAEVREGVAFVEKEMGKKLRRLLRSAAALGALGRARLDAGHDGHHPQPRPQRRSRRRPGRKAGNERFAWDSYRRFIQMYGDVVMGLKPVSKEEHDPFEVVIDMLKEKKGVELDTELDTDDLKELVQRFKALIRARIGREFPTDPWEQLWGA
jgi:pyruvate,orthophosphate dikinase